MAPETPKEEIKKAEVDIKKALDKNGVEPSEVKDLDDASKILDKNKNNEKVKDKIEKYKDKIKDGINKFFDVKLQLRDGSINTSETVVNLENKKLTITQIDAYLNIITRLNATTNDRKDIQIKTIKKALNDKKTILETEVKEQEKDAGKKELFNLLSATPTKDIANNLFGENGDGKTNGTNEFKVAWDALFDNMDSNGKLNIDDDVKTSDGQNGKTMKVNFEALLNLYAGNKDTTIKIKDWKLVVASDSDTNYNVGVKYIKVEYEDTKNPPNTIPSTDIMFGKTTDIIHQARADHYVINSLKEQFNQAFLKAIDDKGSYRTFERYINEPANNGKLKTLLESGTIFKEINEYHVKDGIDDKAVKENGYYSVITDYVVQQAKGGDLIILQNYLKYVNKENIKYLGNNDTTKLENYTKLESVVTSPNFPKDTPLSKQISEQISSLKVQLKTDTPKNFKETLDKGVDAFFKIYGKGLVDVLEWFGGKGAIRGLLHSLGMDKIYNDYFKDKLDEVYKEKYALSSDQKKSVEELAKEIQNTSILASSATGPVNNLEGKTIKAKFEDQQSKFQSKIDIKLFDPNIVFNAINYNNKQVENNVDGFKKMEIDNYLTKDSKGNYELKENIDETGKGKIIDAFMNDPTTWNTIAASNNEIVGYIPEGKKENTRSDLDNDKRTERGIQTTKDVAIYLASYAYAGSKKLDYVITETPNMPFEAKKTPNVKVETAEEAKIKTTLDSINNEVKIISNDKYKTYDYIKYVKYNANASGDEQTYQTNILSKFKETLTGKNGNINNFTSLVNVLSADSTKAYESLFTNPIHLKNTLIMMQGEKNDINLYKTVIEKLNATPATYTMEAGSDKITLTANDGSKIILSNDATGDKLQAVLENKTEDVDPNTKVKKTYLNTIDGTLKGIGDKRIDQIIDVKKSSPKLKITLNNNYNPGHAKGSEATIILGKENGTGPDTYVFEDTTTRVKIADGDKIEKSA